MFGHDTMHTRRFVVRPFVLGECSDAKPDSCLLWSYPNPTNAWAVVRYSVPEGCEVRLEVYDMLGRLVRVLLEGAEASGYGSVFWDCRDEEGREVSSGTYLCRLRAGKFDAVRKMVILR